MHARHFENGIICLQGGMEYSIATSFQCSIPVFVGLISAFEVWGYMDRRLKVMYQLPVNTIPTLHNILDKS